MQGTITEVALAFGGAVVIYLIFVELPQKLILLKEKYIGD